MRVFLTGASGFIGAHVLRALLDRGHVVTALVSPGNPLWRLRGVNDLFSAVVGRLNCLDLLRVTLAEFQPEVWIHLAWYAKPGKYLQSTKNISSMTDSVTLMRILSQVGCRQVVMAGTCAEYDTDLGYLREDTPTRPVTLYAAAKLACFLIGQQIAAQAKINFAWGRIFYPYGPQEDVRRLVPAVIRTLLNGRSFAATYGEQVRDYIHVEDVAVAFCVLAENQTNGVFNISSGVPVTIHHLLETIGSLIGHDNLIKFGAQPYRTWEPPFICGENLRLKEHGWHPKYSLLEGLNHTLRWWENNL